MLDVLALAPAYSAVPLTDVQAIAAGQSHTCAVVTGGVQCWGEGSNYQLGNGFNPVYSSEPVNAIAAGSDATDVAAAANHTCAAVDGGVQCWGNGGVAMGPVGTSSVPVQVIPAQSLVTAIATSSGHTCVVIDGGVQCWGQGSFGMLGDGSTSQSATPVVSIPAQSGATAVMTGSGHTCAIVNGGVMCWGNGAQLGVGSTTNSSVPVVTIPAGSNVTSIGGGGTHTCAAVNGGVKCWGSNSLGNGSAGSSLIPVQVTNLPDGSGATAIAAGSYGNHTCAVVSGGVKCWGSNTYGELGLGVAGSTALVPFDALPPGSGATSAAVGQDHSCAVVNELADFQPLPVPAPQLLKPTGTPHCWGSNDTGQLANGTGGPFSSTPRQTQTLGDGAGASMVATGLYYSAGTGHSCAVVNGGVQCWGSDADGALGDGVVSHSSATGQSSDVPVVAIAAGSGATAVSAGSRHTCAVVAGAVYCWGDHSAGQTGTGTHTSGGYNAPILSQVTAGATQIAAGQQHTCAVVNGGAQCWGGNSGGSLGNGNTTLSDVPVDVVGLSAGSGVVSIGAGGSYSCAVVGGGVSCWGSNAYGQLGNGTTTNSSVPVIAIPANSGATAVALAQQFTCAVVNGGAWCWGQNLGSVPVQIISDQSHVVAIAAGSPTSGQPHGCALIDGGVQCWGEGSLGELGNGVTSDSSIPVVAISAGSGVTAIGAGGARNCVVMNGGVKCWGYGVFGELGDGLTGYSTDPNHPVVVARTASGVDLTANPASAPPLQTVTLTAVVTPSDASGTVTFREGSTTLGTRAVTGGVATLTKSNFSLGVHRLTAIYNGDAVYSNAISNTIDVTIAPTITITPASLSGAAVGSVVSTLLSASGGTAPYVFSVSAGTLPPGLGLDSGTGLLSGTLLTTGNYDFTVQATDANDFTGSRSYSLAVTQVVSGIAIISSLNPSTFGQAVTFTATVSGLGPAGTADFKDGASPVCSGVTLSAGQATCTTSTLTGGGHSITAAYSGDTNNTPSTSAALSQQVNPAASGTTVSSSLNPSTYGDGVTFTASVAGANPTGTVEFQADGGTIGGCALQPLSSGQASCGTSALVVGSHSIVAVYSGDGNNAGSTSSALTQLVDSSLTQSSTTFISSANPSPFGEPLVFTAMVNGAAPTGSVRFKADDATIVGCIASPLVAGQAQCVINTLEVGGHPITVEYSGDAANTPSSAGGFVETISVATGTVTPMVAAGSEHTCALAGNGGVKCWGSNQYGKLGDGTTTNRVVPVDVIGLGSGIEAIAAGAHHNCAITTSGGVKCWGNNTYGQLGDGSNLNRSAPVDVVGLSSGVIAITGGDWHTCAVTQGGAAKCWGRNDFAGQLGDNTKTNRSTPVDVIGLSSGVAAIAAGGASTCAITTSGAVKCWGYNDLGNLGDGTTIERRTPVDVLGLSSGGYALALGGSMSCALTTAGGVKCWGGNTVGELGDGTGVQRLTPADVVGLGSPITAIDATGNHVCALTNLGVVKCWGRNDWGNLGDLSTVNRLAPVDVQGLAGQADAIAAGTYHSCALLTSGGVKCWGRNDLGELGDGTTTSRSGASLFVTGLNLTQPPVALISSQNPSVLGQGVTFTATVAGQSPTGTVEFRDGASAIAGCATQPLSAGQATCNTNALTVGSHSITAAYSGDGSNPASSSDALAQAVYATATIFFDDFDDGDVSDWTPSTNVPGLATVSATNGTSVSPSYSLQALFVPTGPVTDLYVRASHDFMTFAAGPHTLSLQGRSGVCSGCTISFDVLVDGVLLLRDQSTSGFKPVTLPLPPLSAGIHVLTLGMHSTNASSGPFPAYFDDVAIVGPVLATSATTLSASPTPSAYAEAVTLTATVTGNAPSGTVEFRDGTAIISSCAARPLAAGVATCVANNLPVGSHSIVARYSGDGGNPSSTAALTHVVNQAVTSTSLVSGPNPSASGQNVTFTATVAGAAPTGAVDFDDGASVVCSAVGLSGGQATCTTSALAVGVHSVTAIYSGDANNAPSTSGALSQTVNPASTSTSVGSSLNPSGYGQSVTFTATVSGASPSGTVDFEDGASAICTGVALSGGQATCATSTLTGGGHSITAAYSGDTNNTPSTSAALTQQVDPAATGTSVGSTLNPSIFGDTVTFTASVTGANPTGTMEFKADGGTIGGCATQPLSSAQASCGTSALLVGSHSIVAVYSGDGNNAGSTSSALTQQVNPATVATTTAVASSLNPSAYGDVVTFAATVTGNSPSGTVHFKADGVTIVGCVAAPLTAGQAQCVINILTVGDHAITADYSGDVGNDSSASPVLTQTITVAVGNTTPMIATGINHGCALTSSGGVRCWGYNVLGQVGDGTNSQRLTPVDVAGLSSGVSAIAAGYAHTCALTAAGAVKCWGANGYGQLGDSTTGFRLTPVDVTGLVNGVRAISAGGDHTCAITISGGAKCWGSNAYGQLGDGTNVDRHTPVDVASLTSGVDAITGGSGHTCALTTSGGVKCWGRNDYGQLGDGTTSPRPTQADVTGLTSGMSGISAGALHTCALTADGGAKCWGLNVDGELGDGTTSNRPLPVGVTGFATGLSAIDAGSSHTCALTNQGGIRCWGNNSSGQLGDGTGINRLTPVDVTGLTGGADGISASANHTCALTRSGGVRCWGGNGNGELGDGTTTSRMTASLFVTGLNLTEPPLALVSSSNPSTEGQSITFTTTVTGTTPAGTVEFKDGTSTIGTCATQPVSGGQAMCTSNALVAGTHSITAVYSGDAANGPNASVVLTQIVNPLAVTTTAVVASPNPSVYGQSVTFTATVAGATPTGAVDFMDGASVICSAVALSGGQATCTTSALAVGGHSITAIYSGDANNAASTSGALSQTVNPASTSTSVGSSLDPSVYGQAVTFTATVGGVSPSGTVDFKDGASAICSGVALSGGQASCTTSTLAGGGHSITAAYSGDTNNTPSASAALTQQVNPATTSTSVGSSLNPSIFGDTVTFTATVTGASATGTVEFKADGGTIGGCALQPLSSGQAGCGTNALAVGSHSIIAVYSGDGNNAGSISSALTQQVNPATVATTTTLASSLNPSAYGDVVTFTSTVAGNSPTGSVHFKADGTTIVGCVAAPLTAGQAQCIINTLEVGSHAITAEYSGDAANDSSTSSALAQAIAVTTGTITPMIATGVFHSCALTSSGAVKCWGMNDNGQLGDGTTAMRVTPVDVVGLGSGVEKIATGEYHTCALTSGGGVKCWGSNAYGQLGDGNSGTNSPTPVDVAGLGSGMIDIAGGGGPGHTCAVTGIGGVKCWGSNSSGQLGDGTSGNTRLTPVDVAGLGTGVIGVAAGSAHTCALTMNGGVKCWGANTYGQVGDGTSGNNRTTPVDVAGMATGVMAVATGVFHSCALTSGGGLKCWGYNGSGQLGDGSGADRLTPVAVVGMATGVVAVATGSSHTCGLTNIGGAKCWGYNQDGQLGDGSYSTRYTPADVAGLTSGVAAVAAGNLHTCALVVGGGVKCWGANQAGQLGDGTQTGRPTPTSFVIGLNLVDPSVVQPTITSFSPTTSAIGATVTIDGTNFAGATSVNFNGAPATYVVDSATRITTLVPVGATSGPITVITPGGTATSALSFTVIPPPAITGFAPASGGAGTSVTITGANFIGASVVTFNGTGASYVVNSPIQITAAVPAGATTGPIAVTTPGGSATSGSAFTVIPPPTISSFSPASGPIGTSVTIAGGSLAGATAVTFNGKSATYVVNSATQITAAVPTGATTGPIAVTTLGGSATSATAFTVTVGPAPTISTLSPASGPVGTPVTIKGTNFSGASSVTFNGVSAVFAVKSSTQITATVPVGASSGSVVVTTPGGTATSATPFTVTAPPTISGFTPPSGPIGTVVTITGTNFTGATAVKFANKNAAFTVTSATSISATVPNGAKTGTISVTNPAGTAMSASNFTVTP